MNSANAADRPALSNTSESKDLQLFREVATVAAIYADDVDREARFPHEAAARLKELGLYSVLVRQSHGGEGWSYAAVCEAVEVLARACSATAMVFAMHQIQVACLVNHDRSAGLDAFLRRVAAEQLLLASATTEKAVSGAVRTSVCCVQPLGDNDIQLVKEASIMSYAKQADAILVTTRRNADAPPSDQVLVAINKDRYTLEQTNAWDTLGFRGTESAGYILRAEAPADCVFADSFADISRRTMLPVSHLVWSHLWTGMAAECVGRARSLLRKEARKHIGQLPAMANGVVDLVNRLQLLRSLAHDAAHEYERVITEWQASPTSTELAIDGLAFSVRMNGLKLNGSQSVVELITDAIEVCGMPAYQASGPYALGRYLRDAHGARVMINNNRLIGANAAWLLVSKED